MYTCWTNSYKIYLPIICFEGRPEVFVRHDQELSPYFRSLCFKTIAVLILNYPTINNASSMYLQALLQFFIIRNNEHTSLKLGY